MRQPDDAEPSPTERLARLISQRMDPLGRALPEQLQSLWAREEREHEERARQRQDDPPR
jgi:hypothetical protein